MWDRDALHKELHKDLGFKLPPQIEELLDEMETVILEHPLQIDLYQDEIRSWAHGCTDREITEEQGEIIIDHYCRRRWD